MAVRSFLVTDLALLLDFRSLRCQFGDFVMANAARNENVGFHAWGTNPSLVKLVQSLSPDPGVNQIHIIHHIRSVWDMAELADLFNMCSCSLVETAATCDLLKPPAQRSSLWTGRCWGLGQGLKSKCKKPTNSLIPTRMDGGDAWESRARVGETRDDSSDSP